MADEVTHTIQEQENKGAVPEAPVRHKRHSLLWDLLRVCLITAVFIAAAVLLRNETIREQYLNVDSLRQTLHPKGTWANQLSGYGLFIIISALLITFGMPRIWVSAAAGSIYGAVLGTLMGLLGSLVGASGTYLLGRSLLRSVARRRLGSRYVAWSDRFHRHSFLWTLYMRLFPIFNTTLGSLICGSSGVRYRSFLGASAIGFLPMTLVFAVFGSGATKGNGVQLGLGTLLFVGVFGIQWLYTRVLRSQGEKPAEEQGLE